MFFFNIWEGYNLKERKHNGDINLQIIWWSLSSYYHHYRIMDHFSIKEVIIGNLFARQFKTVFNESIDFKICCIAYKPCKIRMIMLEVSRNQFSQRTVCTFKAPSLPPSLECPGNNDGSAVFPVWWSHSSGKSDSLLKNFISIKNIFGGLDTF